MDIAIADHFGAFKALNVGDVFVYIRRGINEFETDGIDAMRYVVMRKTGVGLYTFKSLAYVSESSDAKAVAELFAKQTP